MTRQPEPDAGGLASSEMLRRIADALGLPMATFFEPDDAVPETIAQASEILMIFNAIRDPEARLRCLAFARTTSVAGAD